MVVEARLRAELREGLRHARALLEASRPG